MRGVEELVPLIELNIKAVFTIMKDAQIDKLELPKEFIELHIKIPAEDLDEYKISEHFDSLTEMIKKELSKKNNVYVHCQAGASRSATIVAAYLIRYENMTSINAIKLLK